VQLISSTDDPAVLEMETEGLSCSLHLIPCPGRVSGILPAGWAATGGQILLSLELVALLLTSDIADFMLATPNTLSSNLQVPRPGCTGGLWFASILSAVCQLCGRGVGDGAAADLAWMNRAAEHLLPAVWLPGFIGRQQEETRAVWQTVMYA